MHRIAFASILGIFIASPALAQSEIVITQAKALAGNVTPGDTAGFPVTLTRPGAYVLASTLTVPAGSYGFQINASNVDLDMNGFVLSGGGVANYGIVSHNFGESRIHGGTINAFKSYGIYVRRNGWAIENMQIVRNGGSGIDATGARFVRVQKSLLAANGGHGAIVGDEAEIIQNIVSENKLSGVICGGSCHVEANKIGKNVRTGITIENGLVIGNTVNENGKDSQPIGIGYYGIYGSNSQRLKVGIINNVVIDNCPLLARQTLFVEAFGPNSCIGTPC